MEMTVEEFENKCMDVIEQIVSIDIRQNREGAIKITEKMLEKASVKGNQKVIDIYQRVLNEFKIATDKEYDLLKRQIFDMKG